MNYLSEQEWQVSMPGLGPELYYISTAVQTGTAKNSLRPQLWWKISLKYDLILYLCGAIKTLKSWCWDCWHPALPAFIHQKNWQRISHHKIQTRKDWVAHATLAGVSQAVLLQALNHHLAATLQILKPWMLLQSSTCSLNTTQKSMAHTLEEMKAKALRALPSKDFSEVLLGVRLRFSIPEWMLGSVTV